MKHNDDAFETSVTILRRDFEVFEKVRESGLINMYDFPRVQEIAYDVFNHVLEIEIIKTIIRNYDHYKNKYKDKQKFEDGNEL